MRNVEIKAAVENIDVTENIAKQLSDSPLVIIKQIDVFFCLPGDQTDRGGRLKLRQFDDGSAELIYYERPNVKHAKLSTYSIARFDKEASKNLKQILTVSNGVLGTVEKIRHLYMVGQTRIHVDRVIGLGNFIELEVVLNDNEDLSHGNEIAMKLMNDLNIPQTSLLSGAYLDMILKNGNNEN